MLMFRFDRLIAKTQCQFFHWLCFWWTCKCKLWRHFGVTSLL